MGTRSTVHFISEFEDGEATVLSIYQQYDGYLEGVGAQIVETLKKHTRLGDGTEFEESPKANGFHDLALLYVVDHKPEPYNMYVTTADNTQEYNYYIREEQNPQEILVTVTDYDNTVIFTGTAEEFIEKVEGKSDVK